MTTSGTPIGNVHRSMVIPIYVPAMLLGVPAQASLVLLPLYVLALDGSPAQAAAVIGFRGLGMMVMDIPAGILAARFGDRFVMLAAIAMLAVAHLGFALTDQVLMLHAVAFLFGCGGSSFLLGRMSYVAAHATPLARGRVIALIAGSLRASALIGPLLGGIIAETAGFEVAFLCSAAAIFLGWLCVRFATVAERPTGQQVAVRDIALLGWQMRQVFASAGVAAIVFMVLRSARTVLVPLIGASIGLDAKTIGIVVSISAAVDVAMFYPAGLVMDRYGRRATAVPSSILLTISLALLALVEGLYGLTAVAICLGFANGLSTGIVMALGTDLAPPAARGQFLGLWRLLTDIGTAAGPLIVGAVVASAPIAHAALGIAALGTAGSFVIFRYVEETLVKQ